MGAVGVQTTLDTTPPEITISAHTTTETQITVTLQLNEVGTAYCRPVRKDYAAPTTLDILELNEPVAVAAASSDTEVVMTQAEAALHKGTDYDVYCYAEDDLCYGCKTTSGISRAGVLATKTQVRTLDTTPPKIQVVGVESPAHDKISIRLRLDEGAKVRQ